MGTEATWPPRQPREKINCGGERAAEGTAARENGKVRVEGTAARESGGVGSGGPAAKGRPADLRTARLGEKGGCLRREPPERWTAAELLTHPFVRCRDEELDVELELKDEFLSEKKRNMPKSILDQDHWASWGSEDDEEPGPRSPVAPLSDSAEERLRRIASVSSVGSPPVDETWDKSSWVNVRSGSYEFPIGGRICAVGGEKSPAVRLTTHLPSPLKDFLLCTVDVCSCNSFCTKTSLNYEMNVQDS